MNKGAWLWHLLQGGPTEGEWDTNQPEDEEGNSEDLWRDIGGEG